MSAALPSPADCCGTCPPSACGNPIDFTALVAQALGGQLNIINVMDPQWAGGAKGDGITDDTAAIQAAIDAALASLLRLPFLHDQDGIGQGMIPVYFPRPSVSYKITNTITVATDYFSGLEFIGAGSLIVQHTDGIPIISFTGIKLQFVRISGFIFDYATQSTNPLSKCIAFEGGTVEGGYCHFTVENCNFLNGYTGIGKQDNAGIGCTVWGLTVRNCRFYYFYGSGIDLTSASPSGNPSNVFENIYGWCYRMPSTTGPQQPFIKLHLEQNVVLRNVEINNGYNVKFIEATLSNQILIEQSKIEVSHNSSDLVVCKFDDCTNIDINNFGINSILVDSHKTTVFALHNIGGESLINTMRIRNVDCKFCTNTGAGEFYIVGVTGFGPTSIDYPYFYGNTDIDGSNLVDYSTRYDLVSITQQHRADSVIVREADFDGNGRYLLDISSAKRVVLVGPFSGDRKVTLPTINSDLPTIPWAHEIEIARVDDGSGNLHDVLVEITFLTGTFWRVGTTYPGGSYVLNGGKSYYTAAGGVSGSGTGPTGTGVGIIDGTVSWDYVPIGYTTLKTIAAASTGWFDFIYTPYGGGTTWIEIASGTL